MPIAGILAALLYAATATSAAAIPLERPVLRVTVEPEAGLPLDRRVLADSVQMARQIWRPYADISFQVAADAVRSSGGLRLVITDRVSALSNPASLGWIEFVDGRPSDMITVSTTAMRALLKASRWSGLPKTVQQTFLARALGRAVAHELGHYLLASREHTARGLMRGQLTADDIMQPRPSSYRLDRAELQRLQQSFQFARRDDSSTLSTKE